MDEVREEYKAILRRVLDRVREKHDTLDCDEIHAKDGMIGIGRTAWPTTKGWWISGLWLGGIGIDNLTMEDEEAPYAMVRINHPKKAINLEVAERKLRAAAKNILTREDFRHLDSEVSSGEANISYYLREPRHKLLGLLNGDGNAFVDLMVAHFETLTDFIAVLDRIFQVGRKKGR
jgi:hypothetical protein